MGILSDNPFVGLGTKGTGYQINQSLRFNSADSTRLSRTTSGFGITTTCTISWWHKKAAGSTSNTHWMIGTYPSMWSWESTDTSTDGFRWVNKGGTVVGPSGSKYRDYSGWYHWIITQNGTVSKVYLNGVLIKQDNNNSGSSADGWHIGSEGGTDNFLNGYLAEFIFLDGIAVADATSFGETDSITGAWIPKKYTGSFGTDGFYLKFDPSATNGIGHDHSGNGNNFTATGFSTSGTGTDVMSDTPTNNWCTLNPLDKNTSASAPSDGNLSWNQSSAAWYAIRGTVGVTSGKWYWETKLDSGLYGAIGIGNSRADLDGYSAESNVWSYVNNGRLEANGTGSVWGNTYTTGDVIGVALDADTGKLWFSKNGTWQESGNPSAGTNPAVSGLAADSYFPYFVHYQTTISVNFGQRAFTYGPPRSDFKPLNTANLPEPTIKKGSKYFDTKLYTGNGSTQSISGLEFSPDLVWIKSRTNPATGYYHHLVDAVRGSNGGFLRTLYSNGTEAEDTYPGSTYGGITSLDANGFSLANVGASAFLNNNTTAYVAWAWDANGAGSSNTAGTITSTVSANASAGFSIVTYTGTGTAGTVGHGLGVAPRFVIVRKRSGGTMGGGYSDWLVYSQAAVDAGKGSDAFLYLNTTGNTSNSSSVFGSAPTSTIFNIGNNQIINNSGSLFVAYCFSEVAGYSKFGSYTGNNSSDGSFIYTGFAPSFVMIKALESANWVIFDTSRSPYNLADDQLSPNTSGAEVTNDGTVDLLSNGFKLRNGAATTNAYTYVYAAFASTPFKYSTAR